jgi:DNA (cytosine-5)-methyltransferase 1
VGKARATASLWPKAKLEAVSVTSATAGSLWVAEFSAEIGLVRLGLENAGFRVVWANDIETDKQKMYVQGLR